MTKMKSSIYIKIFLISLLWISVINVTNTVASGIISIEDVQIPEKSKTHGILMISEVLNLGSFSINLSWDPSIVNIEKISDSDFVIIPYFNNNIGFVNITGYTISALNGNADIANFLFEAVGNRGSSCFLKVTYCQLFTADPRPEVIDCNYDVNLTTITITEAAPDNNNNNAHSGTKQEEDNILWYAFISIVIIILIIIGATIGRRSKSQEKSKSKEK